MVRDPVMSPPPAAPGVVATSDASASASVSPASEPLAVTLGGDVSAAEVATALAIVASTGKDSVESSESAGSRRADDGSRWRRSIAPYRPAAASSSEALPGRARLSEDDRHRLDAAFTHASPTEREVLTQIFSSPVFLAASAVERQQILDLACAMRGYSEAPTDPRAHASRGSPLAALALALDTTLDGRPRLLHPGTDGNSALFHVHAALSTPLSESVASRLAPMDQSDLVAGLLREVGDPREVDQAELRTCSATSLQSFMALRTPGEYARLVVALATVGEVSPVSGGVMRADLDGLEPGSQGSRSASERLFQSAVLEHFGTGNYSMVGDRDGFGYGTDLDHLPWLLQLLCFLIFPLAIILSESDEDFTHVGLFEEELREAALALTGRDYVTRSEPTAALDEVRRLSDAGNLDAMGVFITFWPFNPAVPDKGHMLVVSGIDDSTTPPALILHDPLGRRGAKPGEPYASGPTGATWDDPEAALIRVPLLGQSLASIAALHFPDPNAAPISGAATPSS